MNFTVLKRRKKRDLSTVAVFVAAMFLSSCTFQAMPYRAPDPVLRAGKSVVPQVRLETFSENDRSQPHLGYHVSSKNFVAAHLQVYNPSKETVVVNLATAILSDAEGSVHTRISAEDAWSRSRTPRSVTLLVVPLIVLLPPIGVIVAGFMGNADQERLRFLRQNHYDHGTIAPGETRSGFLFFEIPKGQATKPTTAQVDVCSVERQTCERLNVQLATP